MGTTEDLQDALSQAAALIDEATAVLLQSPTDFALNFEDGGVIKVILDPEREVISIVSSIGMLPENNQNRIFEGLLRFSATWRETSGTTIQLHDSNQILQMLTIGTTVELTTLVAAIKTQRERAIAWSEVIERVAASDPESSGEVPELDGGVDGRMMV